MREGQGYGSRATDLVAVTDLGGGGKFGAFRAPAHGWVTICRLRPPSAWVSRTSKDGEICNYVVFEIQSMD